MHNENGTTLNSKKAKDAQRIVDDFLASMPIGSLSNEAVIAKYEILDPEIESLVRKLVLIERAKEDSTSISEIEFRELMQQTQGKADLMTKRSVKIPTIN